MEEDIKILEEYLNKNDHKYVEIKRLEFLESIENLIEEYRKIQKELKQEKTRRINVEIENENICNEVNNNYIRKKLVIPKLKVKEKIEELDNMIKEINKRKTSKVHSRRDCSF